jgi:hypothetical protein
MQGEGGRVELTHAGPLWAISGHYSGLVPTAHTAIVTRSISLLSACWRWRSLCGSARVTTAGRTGARGP